MKKVDAEQLYRKTENARYLMAKKCEHFAVGKKKGPCLWHHSYCLHPNRPDPNETGQYAHCDLVWHGYCDPGAKKTDAKEQSNG